ncbi:DUF3417 domain-containing protein [Neosynechococcus sphagnicola]|uniref:DUF3417 domain-containing protein n=1 Tax=Neosynechococcus sphagnicola TaxID=1501145 RepID=UPI001EF9FC49|nr:DUF3417 domain-containing protein [Neosynechococcus sphagnicola]
MSHSYSLNHVLKLREKLPLSLKRLADLAYNYWWSWTSDRIYLFQSIDPTEWQRCGHNPVASFRIGLFRSPHPIGRRPFLSQATGTPHSPV